MSIYTDDPIYEPEPQEVEVHPSRQRNPYRHRKRRRRERVFYALRVYATDLKRRYQYRKPDNQLRLNLQ